jgi:hypothetical protein
MKVETTLTSILFLVFFSTIASAEYITGCTVINMPGEYFIINDFSECTRWDCISIQASNVILDGQNHKIPNCAIGGVYSDGYTNITIKNIIFYYFGNRAFWISSSNVTIENITVYPNLADNEIHGSNVKLRKSIFFGPYGVIFSGGPNHLIENNTFYDAWLALVVQNSTVTSNFFLGKGIFLQRLETTLNLIYNNFFNSTEFFRYAGVVAGEQPSLNYWNISKTYGTNIIGGPYIGGNYWGKPDGTGYSDTCEDSNKDGFCDNPYVIATNNIDYLPLAHPPIIIPKPVTYVEVLPPIWLIFVAVAVLCVIFEVMKRAGV